MRRAEDKTDMDWAYECTTAYPLGKASDLKALFGFSAFSATVGSIDDLNPVRG